MIRKATIADRPRISEVRLAVRENRLGQASMAKVDKTADWIFENAAFWVWEEDGAAQGFAVADPRDGTIFGLFVHPDYEGRGLARVLLPRACEDLRAAGFSVATLTDRRRHAGRALLSHQRLGGDRPPGRRADHLPQVSLSGRRSRSGCWQCKQS